MGKLPGMAGYNALVRLVVIALRCDLVQDWYNEDGSFTHTGLGLTENILSLKGLGNGIDLNLTGMLKAAFSDGAFQFVFEEKFVPSSKVGTCIFLLIDSWLLIVRTVVVWQYVVHRVVLLQR